MDRTRQSGTRLSDLPTASEPSLGAPEPITKHSGRFLPSTRYRHPGDVIRLIGSGLVLTGMLAAVALAPNRLTGPGAVTVTWLGSDPAGRLLTGLVQVALVLAATVAVAATLRHRRFRLLAGLAAGAVTAGAVLAGILYLAGDKHPHTVTAAAGHSSWLASAAFPGPALLAAAVAVTVARSREVPAVPHVEHHGNHWPRDRPVSSWPPAPMPWIKHRIRPRASHSRRQVRK